MNLNERINAFIALGKIFKSFLAKENSAEAYKYNEIIEKSLEQAFAYNGWFTRDEVLKMFNSLASQLEEDSIKNWVEQYHLEQDISEKTIAIIMAGNIPLVGFNDLFCTLISGHHVLIKPSSDDTPLITMVLYLLHLIDERITEKVKMAEMKLTGFDAVIATGNDNTSRYFEYYFGKYPHIIRKNRTSIAIIDSKTTSEELKMLGNDIFSYYGLGCRSVTKLYVPMDFVIDHLYEALFSYSYVINNKKYGNNYEYNRAIYLMNGDQFLDNNFLLIKETKELHSPIGVLFIERYSEIDQFKNQINSISEKIQCIISNGWFENEIKFGDSQVPDLNQYADNVDTMQFLKNFNRGH